MRLQSTIFLTLVCLTLRIDSQNLKPTSTYNGDGTGSGKLFYEDDLPRNLNTHNGNLSNDEGHANLPQEHSQFTIDSYSKAHQQLQQNRRNGDKQSDRFNQPITQNSNLQRQYQTLNQKNLQNQNLNQYNNLNRAINPNQYNQDPNLNPNSNYQFQQNMEILPPSHTSQDYYVTKQSLQKPESGINNRYKTQPNVVPLSQNSQDNMTQDQDMKLVSAVISHIGIFMMESARENHSNVVVSPMSVVNMLALLQAGATGVTQKQVSNALRLTPEKSAAAFQLINTQFRKRGAQRNVLRSASSIFVGDTFELSRDFKNFAIQKFGSDISKISFENPNAAAQKINSWIASQTNEKIDKLVSPDSIGVNTQLVLANAIYFKGLWETTFKPDATSLQDFFMSNGQKKSVPFMTLRSGFRAGLDKANNAIVVVLPFENKEYSLVMLLPTPGADVTAVLAGLNGETLADYQNLRLQDVFLQIPKFTVRSNTDLQPVFAKMGITKMFSSTSELSNIGLYHAYSPQVSSAVHSAMLSVDEQGATAAAATVVAVVALSYDNPSVVFRADRPFLAVLWDNQLSVPLFMIKVEDPSQ